MGRAKLEIKYRENFRARLATYMSRMKGLKKKASELSVLCGVDVLLAIFSPEFNTVQFWPEKDTSEFRRIRERYYNFCSKFQNRGDCTDKRNYGNNEDIPCFAVSSPSFPSILEEMAAMNVKLQEVRERLCFLRSFSGGATNEEQPLQVMLLSQQQEEQPLHIIVSPFLPLPEEQPSPFPQPRPALADFTMDDLIWCDSLLNYNES